MKQLSVLEKLVAILRRDLLTAMRYRTAFWMQAVTMILEIAGSYYLARAVGPGFQPEGLDYYPFLLIGTGVYTLFVAGINSFVMSIRDAQLTGTLEVLMTTSTSGSVIVLLNTFSAFVASSLSMVLYLAVGLALFHVELRSPNLLGCALVVLISIGIATAIGIVAAALQVLVQKGGAIVWLLGAGGWLFAGMMFPVAALPKPFQVIAAVIPLKYSLDGVRLALLRGASFTELIHPLGALTAFCVLLLPLSLVFFSYAVRRARLQGTLSFY